MDVLQLLRATLSKEHQRQKQSLCRSRGQHEYVTAVIEKSSREKEESLLQPLCFSIRVSKGEKAVLLQLPLCEQAVQETSSENNPKGSF